MQRVCINGIMSDWKIVFSGVPHGSILGPILFLIYINDLGINLSNWILKFADDTKLFGVATKYEDQLSLQDDLNKLLEWSIDWQMLFNIDKCKVMHLGKSDNPYCYQLQGIALEDVAEEKDLGIIINSDLKVSNQCSQAYAKASKMNRSIVYKSANILLKFYKSLVRPHVEYCTAAWSPHYTKDIQLLEKIQHRFTRMIPGMKKLLSQYSTLVLTVVRVMIAKYRK